MPQVGVRELKNEVSEVIRAVREDRAEYIVTYRGQPVAMILPLEGAAPAAAQPSPELLRALAELRERVTAAWCGDLTAVEAVAEQRR